MKPLFKITAAGGRKVEIEFFKSLSSHTHTRAQDEIFNVKICMHTLEILFLLLFVVCKKNISIFHDRYIYYYCRCCFTAELLKQSEISSVLARASLNDSQLVSLEEKSIEPLSRFGCRCGVGVPRRFIFLKSSHSYLIFAFIFIDCRMKSNQLSRAVKVKNPFEDFLCCFYSRK